MSHSTKEKTHNGGNRVGFISKNLDVNAMSEMYQNDFYSASVEAE